MHRLFVLFLFVLLTAPPGVQAQQATIPEPPVRYDADALPPAFHQNRREAVRAALPEEAVALFFSAPVRQRENDVDFEYRQSSDLYYLTGTPEPASVLILAPGGFEVDGETVKELLLVPPRTQYSDVWLGRRFGAARAQAELGVEKAVSNERFEEIFGALLADESRRLFLLPLPEGVDEGSALGQQIAFVTERARPLEAQGNFLVRQVINAMLTVEDAEDFAQIQQIARGRLNAEEIDEPALRSAYETFLEAETVEGWRTWLKENFYTRYPDSATLGSLLTRLRVEKTEEEVALLQRAIDITVAAHREAMKSIEPGMHEYEIEALIEYIFRRGGAEYSGFPSIVASGENSVILHYNSNRRQMEGGDLVVIDIGAEYRGYTADVTRTLPVDGNFSPEEKAIYEIVLRAQQVGIQATRAGNPFNAPGQAASQVIAEGLRELGLIDDASDTRRFFMHGTSHYLGLYVHDVGTGGPLTPGTVITVEPGIYIAPSPDVDPKWWNIGVRIEDDVLVTSADPLVMSKAAPRTVEEIEALMQQRGLGNEPVAFPSSTQ